MLLHVAHQYPHRTLKDRNGIYYNPVSQWQAGAEVQMVVPANMAFGDKGICIENGDCLVKPGMEVRYDLQLKRVAPTP